MLCYFLYTENKLPSQFQSWQDFFLKGRIFSGKVISFDPGGSIQPFNRFHQLAYPAYVACSLLLKLSSICPKHVAQYICSLVKHYLPLAVYKRRSPISASCGHSEWDKSSGIMCTYTIRWVLRVDKQQTGVIHNFSLRKYEK